MPLPLKFQLLAGGIHLILLGIFLGSAWRRRRRPRPGPDSVKRFKD